MIRKSVIAYIIFSIIVCYIISPSFFERYFYFNELLSILGFLILIQKKFRVGLDRINISITILLLLNIIHCAVSLFFMDHIYSYLRNLVIFYSIFTYFLG